MYEYHGLHEAYYNHNCLIVPEKDILDTDIVGIGCISRIRRWWNDLFLLSTAAANSRGFYLSSHAVMIERFRHFRKYNSRIHPMSKFRDFWDCFILHVFVMNKLIFRITSTFIFDKLPIDLYYLGAMFDIITIGDLFISYKTGYIDFIAKRVILDTKKSMIHFCSRKLFIHLAAAMPLHWFMFLKYGTNIDCGLCKANRFTCILKIISVFSLFRVFEASAYWTNKQRSANRKYFFRFLRITVLGLVTMCQFYDLMDVVCLLVFFKNGRVVATSTLGIRSGLKYGAMGKYVPNYMYVCYDISRIFRSLLLFTFGIRGKLYYLDILSALLAYLIANAFYFWTLIECFSLLTRVMYPKDQIMRKRDSVLNLLACRQISDELRLKMQQYFDFKPATLGNIIRENELFRSLPEDLKKEIKLSCYIKMIMRIPFFVEWPLEILEDIVQMLEINVYLNNDIVAEAFVTGYGLMIIDCGVLAVYSEHRKELGHLIDGDYFGELSLVTDKEIFMSYVVAINSCTILILEKIKFRTYMRNYPKLFYGMEVQMKQRYNNIVSSTRRKSTLGI